MKLLLLILLSFIISCSTTKEKKPEGYEFDEEKKIDVPTWVYSINDECDTKKFLCASAEGETAFKADLNAKKALASILEVKISSTSEIKKFGLSSLESKGLTEKVNFEVKEEINTVLKGAKILKRFKKSDSYYSYAVLEKDPAIQILKQDLRAIDDKMESLFSQKKRVFVNRLLVLLTKRNSLRERLLLLDGKFKRSSISFADVYELKNSKAVNSSIKIESKGDIPSNLLEKIEEELTSMGFVINKSSAKNTLTLSFSSSEEYLNVKGFKKFSFVLNLKSFDTEGKKRGVLSIKKITSGRSSRDALSSVLKAIVKDINKNLEKLNI